MEILLPSKYYFSPGKVIDIFYIENITITGSYNGKIITVAPEAIRPGVVEPTYGLIRPIIPFRTIDSSILLCSL